MAGEGGLANKIRVGLESEVALQLSAYNPKVTDPLDEIWHGKSVRRHVNEFGALFAALFIGFSAYKIWYNSGVVASAPWCAAGLLVGYLGYFAPTILRPFWKGWMKFAHLLSLVMTPVIMGVVWVAAFLPMAMILRVLKIQVIDQSYRQSDKTYWVKRDPKYDDFQRLRQQY